MCGCALAATALAACGADDFENDPRPPVPIQLTGVITEEEVTVSPRRLGAGPVVITISNQDDRSHRLRLEGEGVEETVGPINPLDTAVLQQSLEPGEYKVSAESNGAGGIAPATLVIGRQRDSASDELQLP